MGPNTTTQLQNIIDTHDRYAKCYFWTVRANAAGRRREEFDHSYEFGDIAVRQYLDISARNYYYKLEVTRDGRKADVRCLKKMLAQCLTDAP